MIDRAVFDCMVFLQAIVNDRGLAFACFERVEKGQITLCVSPFVLAEVRDVTTRPKLQARFATLTNERVEAFLNKVVTVAAIVTDVPRVFVYPRDPDDEPYVNLALAAGASSLVSRDKDLLDLMDDESFHAAYPRLTIIDPVAFLERLRAAESGKKLHD
jgi:putative PIN family toxin of toxin-antitoxin system